MDPKFNPAGHTLNASENTSVDQTHDASGYISIEQSLNLTSPMGFGRTVVPVKDPSKVPKKTMLGFEYAEHCFIGDATTLTLQNKTQVPASEFKFTLKNGLELTYGQINGLAGDFYGTNEPISDGVDEGDRADRFIRAFNTLADPSDRQPKEALDILAILKAEVDAVNEALKNHQDPSVVYSQLPDENWTLNGITKGRPKGQLDYFDLARINWDHFGDDARTAYNTGHAIALRTAIGGDLLAAYAINAFADHFLEDSFAAGHLREPRRYLHKDGMDFTADLCAKYMHDEDNAIGISVSNPNGETWTAYGDKRGLDKEDEDNKNRCVMAVQASVNEIYTAFVTKQELPPAKYRAWRIAPTLESARGHQELAPLFNWDKGRRESLAKRREWVYKTNWWFWSTATDCWKSGLWKYPITIDGIVGKIVPWTSIAATVPRDDSARVLYQRPDGGLLESFFVNGMWIEGPDSAPITAAVLWSPLATISWDNGREVRTYYLNQDYILQEYCFSANNGSSWYRGKLGDLHVKAAKNTSLAAVQWTEPGAATPRIRLYLQEADLNIVQEICKDNETWTRGSRLPAAIRGTGLAALVFTWRGELQIRVYYQAEDLTLHETQWFRSKPSLGWHDGGEFKPVKVPGCVPITAVDFANQISERELRVYWRTLDDDIVETKWVGMWEESTVVTKGVTYGWKFAAAQWEDGKYLRLYYQGGDGSLNEIRNDNNGGWGKKVLLSKAEQ